MIPAKSYFVLSQVKDNFSQLILVFVISSTLISFTTILHNRGYFRKAFHSHFRLSKKRIHFRKLFYS